MRPLPGYRRRPATVPPPGFLAEKRGLLGLEETGVEIRGEEAWTRL